MYDLIVLGAGPAGSTAARTAAGMGLNVKILEKEEFPRYKACGGLYRRGLPPAWAFAFPKPYARGA